MTHHYHFVGIGGIGMGTLASLVLSQGHTVSGSDVRENAMTSLLRDNGVQIAIGHHQNNVNGAQTIIYSSAINEDNPELIIARERAIPILKRGEFLSTLMENQVGITVAGAHGKTTTSSMISNMLIKAEMNPTTAIGGVSSGSSYHSALGSGKYFVAEVDESDGSLLYFHPTFSVITNVDFEHLDFYDSWDKILRTFQEFIEQTHPDGKVVAWGQDEKLLRLLSNTRIDSITYGLSEAQDLYARNISCQGFDTHFDCVYQGKFLGSVALKIPGEHNILNALACIAVGLQFKIDFSIIQESLSLYRGVNRRFEQKGEVGGISIIDDYGHHPSEIAATLKAARSFNRERIITVFQPHRYSRTKLLMQEFAKSFSLTDELIVTDIYAASESPLEGVTAQSLCERIANQNNCRVQYLKKNSILEYLLNETREGDLVLTLGAGDITKISDDLVSALKTKLGD